MDKLISRLIDPEPVDEKALERFLLEQQNPHLREFAGFALREEAGPPVRFYNEWTFRKNLNANHLKPLAVQSIADDANADSNAREALKGRHLLYYGYATFGGDANFANQKKKLILISRQGEQMVFKGKMSHFGGKDDTGMSPTEGLALVSGKTFSAVIALHAAKVTEDGGKQALFVNSGAGGQPLGHNLNPKAYYLAMRWRDHGLTRAVLHHADTVVEVGNPVSGEFRRATPVDFGPATWTKRIADLSPGLEEALKLKTDQECVIRITLGQAIVPPKAETDYKKNLITIATRQYDSFGGYGEAEEPLSGQIALYWKAVDSQAHSVTEAWSSAFISWCVKEAGATAAEFKFSGLHAKYVNHAITSPNAAFAGFDIADANAKPEVGDIINHNRRSGTVSFADAAMRDDFFSHSAIVVEKGEDAQGPYVRTIGGNEATSEHQSGTVGDSYVRLMANGLIKARDLYKFIALIKTRK